jgi:hypothetical protein
MVIPANTTTSILQGYYGSMVCIGITHESGSDVQRTVVATHGWNSVSVLFSNNYGQTNPTISFGVTNGQMTVNHNSNGSLRFRIHAFLGGA